MLKNNPVLILVIIVVLILASTQIINHFLDQSLEERKPAIAAATAPTPVASQTPQSAAPVHTVFPLVPSDPAKYGIILTDPSETPKTPEQWDLFLGKALEKNKVFEQPGAPVAIEVMKKSPEEYEARQKEIDDRIKLYEDKRSHDPSDDDAEHHLKELYILKSLGKILKDKVTAPKRSDIQIPEGLFPKNSEQSSSPKPLQTEKTPGLQLTP